MRKKMPASWSSSPKSLGDLYKLVIAKNGMEAMEKLKKANPDLVLLDMTLPGYISGRNLLFRKEIQHIPVILVSKMEEIDLKVLKVKFENIKSYITKPIDEEDSEVGHCRGLEPVVCGRVPCTGTRLKTGQG